MRGIAALTPVKYKFKQLYPVAGSWGITCITFLFCSAVFATLIIMWIIWHISFLESGTLSTSTPKKQNNNESSEGDRVLNEKAEPIVAFSRPPPLPPVFGPLVAVSLLEMWSTRDNDDGWLMRQSHFYCQYVIDNNVFVTYWKYL